MEGAKRAVGLAEMIMTVVAQAQSMYMVSVSVNSAVLALAWPGSHGFGLAFLGLGFTKP